MNIYECNIGKMDDVTWALIQAPNPIKALRIFVTHTEAREYLERDTPLIPQCECQQVASDIESRFKGAMPSESKGKAHVLNTFFKPFLPIIRDLGWRCEYETACDSCDRYALDSDEYAVNEVADADGAILFLCRECAEEEALNRLQEKIGKEVL